MNFDKERIVTIASVALGIVAIVLAILAKGKIDQARGVVDFDTSVKVATEGQSAAEYVDPLVDEEGNPIDLTEGQFNVVMAEGGILQVRDTTLKIPASKNASEAETLFVYLPGDNIVKYDSSTDYLVINGSTIVRTINASDATYEGICQFTNEDGKEVLIGEKQVTRTAAIAVIHTVQEGNVSDVDRVMVETILGGALPGAKITQASIFGFPINPDWVEDSIVTPGAIELIKGDTAIYVAPYSGSFAEGTTNTLKTANAVFTYSDNIKDGSSGFAPYILEFGRSQDGSSQNRGETYKAKFLSQNKMTLKDIFEF